MPIDASIALQGRGIDTANPLLQFTQLKRQKANDAFKQKQFERLEKNDQLDREFRDKQFASNQELRQLQMANERFKQSSAREQSRFKSSIIGAAQLDGFLEAGDIQGAENFLNRRKAALTERIANGENLDTTETDDALRLLREDPEALKKITSRSIKFGQMAGFLERPSAADVGGATGTLVDRLMKEDPSLTFAEALFQVQTGFRRGMGPDNNGILKPLPGFIKSVSEIEGTVTKSKKTAELLAKKKAALPKAQSSLSSAFAKNDRVINKIDEVLPKISGFTAGFGGVVLSNIPGREARDVEATLDTIKANLGFDELQQMRANSPTGGALGQVSERELALLTATVENLENSQSPEQLSKNLTSLKQQMAESRVRIQEAFDRDFGEVLNQNQKPPSQERGTNAKTSDDDVKNALGL